MIEDRIRAAALAMPDQARAELADELLQSLGPKADSSVAAAWAHEVESRIAAFEDGVIDAIPAATVFDAMRQKLRHP